MEISNTAIVIGIILIIVLFLFVITLSGNVDTTRQVASSTGQFVGGGCGR